MWHRQDRRSLEAARRRPQLHMGRLQCIHTHLGGGLRVARCNRRGDCFRRCALEQMTHCRRGQRQRALCAAVTLAADGAPPGGCRPPPPAAFPTTLPMPPIAHLAPGGSWQASLRPAAAPAARGSWAPSSVLGCALQRGGRRLLSRWGRQVPWTDNQCEQGCRRGS